MRSVLAVLTAWLMWLIHAIKFRPVSGWKDLVTEVHHADLYVSPEGIIGTPLRWALLALSDDKTRWIASAAHCVVTGTLISGLTEPPEQFGVRCCRCEVPLLASHANMLHSLDIPSCPWCYKHVRAFIRSL